MRYIVDRIEDGGWVVLEDADGRTFQVPASWLPGAVAEGTVVLVEPASSSEGGPDTHSLRIGVSAEGTRERAEEAAARRARLRKAPGGDVEL